MRNWSVAGVAVFFAAMGLVALVDPAGVLEIFDVRVESPEGRNEVRAVYGGFGIAVAAALLLGLRDPGLRPGTLVSLALALVGMAAGRLCSFVIDWSAGAAPVTFVAVELALAGALLAGLPKQPTSR